MCLGERDHNFEDRQLEMAPLDLAVKVGKLEEFKERVATDRDIEELKSLIAVDRVEVKGAVQEAILKSEISALKNLLKIWAIVAGFVFPLL